MQRPKPTKQLLIELCGNNQRLISSLHHGLYETPLHDFYPHLNLDDLAVFAASSWKMRSEDFGSFASSLESEDIYSVFKRVNEFGFPWLMQYRRISDSLRTKHERLNPYKGNNLRARLGRVKPDSVQKLKQALAKETRIYLSNEGDYHLLARYGNSDKYVLMHFMRSSQKKGQVIPAYASEIAKLLSRYPVEYELLPKEQKPQEQPKIYVQGMLFE